VMSKRSGFIVKGHGRLLALELLGCQDAPVDDQEYADEAMEYADMIADNELARRATLDVDKLHRLLPSLKDLPDLGLLGMKDFKLPTIEQGPPAGDPNAIPEARKDSVVKLGDVWVLGKHRLVCGDCTSADDVSKLFAGQRAELAFTSPPYADQREYNGGKELSTEHLATFIRAAQGCVNYFGVNLGYARKGGEVLEYWDDYVAEARACGLCFLSWNIWDRGHAFTVGQQTAMFPIDHEWIFVFGPRPKALERTVPNENAGKVQSGGVRNHDGTYSKSKKKPTVKSHRPIGTIFRSSPQLTNDGYDHPARFPLDLPRAYIEAMTKEEDVVYEPFGGSGTTLVAAEELGRSCFLMELDPNYCDLIIRRWQNFVDGNAVHEETGQTWAQMSSEASKGRC
jgi:DNA modification methylase